MKANKPLLATMCLALLVSCGQNSPSPCNCHEVQESLQTTTDINGIPSTVWVEDHQTQPTQANCNTATDWQYNNQATIRWKTVCQ